MLDRTVMEGRGPEMVTALGAATTKTRVQGLENRAGVMEGFHWEKNDIQ